MNGLLDYLSPDQQQALRQQATTQGLLGIGSALLQGATGAPGQGRPRLSQLLGQAIPVGMQAYQGGMDQALREIMLGQQLQEAQKRRQQEAAQQRALQSFVQTLPEDQRSRFEAFPTQAAEAMFREQPESFRQLTAEEAIARGLPENKTYQISSKTGKVSELGGGGVSVTVPVNVSTERKFGEAFATQIAQEDVKLRQSAMAAQGQLDTIQETRNLLEQGKVFTGKFADQKLAVAAAGQALGITGADTNEVVANTERLFANRAKATLDNVRNSGLGAGQGFTDKDREFLEKAVLGNINFTADALKRQLEIEEKVARGAAKKWNDRFKQLPQSTIQATGITPVELIAPQPMTRQTGIKRFNPATGRIE